MNGKPITIGNVEVQPLLDTNLLMNPLGFFGSNGEAFLREYAHLANERGLMSVSITCYLLRSAGKTILIDTGLGPRRRPGFPVGHLDDALAEAGVAPSEIETIIHTHLHIDHVGWNFVPDENGNERAFFPNARHLIQQTEWDYWMVPERMAQPDQPQLAECVEPLRNSGRVDFMDGEKAIDENLVFVSTPGHTPGHVAVGIQSAGETAVIIGDASHHPMQLDHPDWSPTADWDPVMAAGTRERLFEAALADQRTWIAGHWQHPGYGRIVRLDGERVFRAL
jgi:glyoxylase-like metal-dependent hydrolase (beta-lactamase superfamily II)